jgi:signal transduction histidine kinase
MDESQAKEADINEGIEATLKIVWNELKYKCAVNKSLKPLPRIRCYLGQLNQVFMNLLVNAAQAIPEKGEINIETETINGHIVIRISDTGSGIPPEIIPKLFDPFFTTKPAGKGTGLGLAISSGIIQKHNGTIDVESTIGKGTTFTIRLPLHGVPDGE